jgi:hypothetical protein
VLNVGKALTLMMEICSRLKAFGRTGEEHAPGRSQD